MADDRPVETADEQLARVTKELADFKSTVLARLSTRPTGDIEPTIRSTPKAGCLLLQGQTPLRADYPALWQWVQDQGLIGTNLFTVGNGTTTFGLPNMQGRVPIGVGTLGGDTYGLGAEGGASFTTLALANLPNHDHNVSGSANSAGGHTHGYTTGSSGDHGGHSSGTTNVVPPGSGITLPANYSGGSGGHSHGGGTDNQGSHSHSLNISESTVGSGQGFDNRMPYFALNWMIYT